mgnify:CR=1 FL=1
MTSRLRCAFWQAYFLRKRLGAMDTLNYASIKNQLTNTGSLPITVTAGSACELIEQFPDATKRCVDSHGLARGNLLFKRGKVILLRRRYLLTVALAQKRCFTYNASHDETY